MLQVPIIRGFTEIEHVWYIAQETNSNICGGYARYMCSIAKEPVKPGDVDLFPTSEESYKANVAKLTNLGYSTKYENETSLTLKNPENGIYHYTPTVQIIKPLKEGNIVTVGTLEEILGNFDFTCVRIGILNERFCLADDDYLLDEKHKKLVFKNIHCPVSSLLRANKYARKGYYLPPSESLKLFQDWDNRTPEYRQRLIDLFAKSRTEGEDGKSEISQKEVDELEALLRID